MIQKCKTVMYHYIRPLKETRYPNIRGLDIQAFAQQIEYFAKKYTFITAQDLLDAIYENKEIPKESILLTFDDAYKDHYQYVFPILKKRNIQGLFFPPGKAIQENWVLDVNKIHFILATCNNYDVIVQEIFNEIKQFKEQYQLKSHEYYFSEFAKPSRFDKADVIFIKKMLQRELPLEIRSKITSRLFKKFVDEDEELFASELYLTFNEINEMKENNMYFGCHAYSHEWLASMTSNELDMEMTKSLDFFSKINNDKKNWIFCYPYGSYNDQVIHKIKSNEFKIGITANVGDSILTKNNAFLIERYDTNDFPK